MRRFNLTLAHIQCKIKKNQEMEDRILGVIIHGFIAIYYNAILDIMTLGNWVRKGGKMIQYRILKGGVE